jgi:hypothetical protein
VAHDHQTAAPPRKEVLETIEPVEVEIIRRLVEEKKIVERKQEGGQGRASPLPSRERRGRELEQAGREPEVVEHARRPRLEIGSSERHVALECDGVPIFGPRARGGKSLARRLELGLGAGDARPASQQLGQGFGTVALGLLGQVRDGRARRRHHDASRIRRLDPGQNLQEGRLSDPIRTDDTDAVFGPHGEVDVGENPGRTAVLRDPVCDNCGGWGGGRAGHDNLRVGSGGQGSKAEIRCARA